MATIRSNWTRTAPPLTGLLAAADWAGSATMPIPRGTLLAHNDGTNLYIGLDLTAETGVANPNDYFWFITDINNNSVIDSNRDKMFSDWPGMPNRLGMWYMAGPNATWPAPNGQVIVSQVRQGFGASLNSATAHRQWQITFALSDLGITIDAAGPSPILRFGLRIATLGGASGETPANPLGDFSALNQIILSVVPTVIPPPATLGPVIGQVGIIGTGLIAADGYCNVPGPYYITPQQAAFSGTLNLIGNNTTVTALWAAGARKYKVMHRHANTVALLGAAPWSAIRQSWANYQIVGPNDIWESFGPDPSDFYAMVNPALAFTIQNLLFQWTTSAEPDAYHQFRIDFFNTGGGAVPAPAQVLTLKLDNEPATVNLTNILHGGTPVSACAMVNLSSLTDGVQLQYEAFDPEGDLLNYTLSAEFSHGSTATIYTDSYAAHATPAHIWQGLASDIRPVPPAVWVPPFTCAYLFRISAWTRTTNGYQYPVIWNTDFQTVTLIKPGMIMKPVPLSGPAHVVAAGFEPLPEGAHAASQPAKALPESK